MERFRSQPGSLLVVPTATMVEHIGHSLAREGFPVRPREICTLAQFLDRCASTGAAPAPLLDLLIEQALEKLRPQRFMDVAGFPGFRRALAELFEQAPIASLPPDLADLQGEVERNLNVRGMGLRHQRLKSAAEALRVEILPKNIILDGFFTLSTAETDLVVAMGIHAAVTITLPDWPGAQALRNILLSRGFEEQRLSIAHRAASRSGFSAATIEREVEEIARRILALSAEGREFREIGIVLRSREPYAGVVETTLARFGIPARLYFHQPLGSHPALMFFTNVIRSMLAGWDHATLLEAVRMPVSGLGATLAGDTLDFAWRDRLPSAGLPLPAGLDRFALLDEWRRDRLLPLEWSERLKTLRVLLPQPHIVDRADRDQIVLWRSTSAALAAFDEIVDDAAVALEGSGRCALAEFWKQVETALALEQLRVPDARRNVVHVMDAYEARQWEMPVVFVCGLIERHFPQYHREDPILADAGRRRAGLDTAADRQLEERFLFELAVTRATQQTVLSYPRFDEKGEETLPSFFIDGEFAPVLSSVRPQKRPDVDVLRGSGDPPHFVHKTLSPTAIESFLQCPFQFFAGKTLRLKRRPPAPRDCLDLLVQGSVLHRALAEWTHAPLLGTSILDEIFEEECARRRIPEGYRTEAVRLELMRHFRGFIDDDQFALGWSTRTEEKFSYALNPLLSITGRIDRMDIDPGKRAVVIDYKYSAGNKIRERVEDTGEGHAVQGGLYLAAAARSFGLEPAGMLFCGLKKDVVWDGWHVNIPGLNSLGTSSTRQALQDLADNAERAAIRVHEAIAAGDIAVCPADPLKCRWCDYCDICRVESMARVKKAT
jgi:RecB family exonuclease